MQVAATPIDRSFGSGDRVPDLEARVPQRVKEVPQRCFGYVWLDPSGPYEKEIDV